MKSSDSVKVMIDTSSQPLQLNDPTLKLVYKCDYCPALFGQQNGALKKHLLSHSHPTGSLYLARFSGVTLWLAGVYSMNETGQKYSKLPRNCLKPTRMNRWFIIPLVSRTPILVITTRRVPLSIEVSN